MANDLKIVAGEGHNGAPLSDEEKQDLVRKLNEDLNPLEDKMDALKAEITSLHRDFKTATGITKQNFMNARKLAMIEDEDEQKEKTADLELCFNAMSQNAQLSFFEEEDKK